MKHSLKNTLFATLAAALLSCVALPGLASAEICSKIDFTFSSKVYDQVVLYAGNSSVTSRDAACVLKQVSFAGEQERIGKYLIPKLSDPQNINLMLDAVDFQSTKDALTQAGIEAQSNRPVRPAHHAAAPHPVHHAPVHHAPAYRPSAPNHNHHAGKLPPSAVVVKPGHPGPAVHHHPAHHAERLNVVQNVNQKIDYTFASKVLDQVKLYVGNSAYIYASDAAAILKKVDFASYQEEIGAYLCPRVADRENIHLLINVPDFQSTKDALIKACSR